MIHDGAGRIGGSVAPVCATGQEGPGHPERFGICQRGKTQGHFLIAPANPAAKHLDRGFSAPEHRPWPPARSYAPQGMKNLAGGCVDIADHRRVDHVYIISPLQILCGRMHAFAVAADQVIVGHNGLWVARCLSQVPLDALRQAFEQSVVLQKVPRGFGAADG